MVEEEVLCYCEGLRIVSADILNVVQNRPCVITLRSIHFLDCDIQNEAFTASAIQWASESFGFVMPEVKVTFDDTKSPFEKYIYDFS